MRVSKIVVAVGAAGVLALTGIGAVRAQAPAPNSNAPRAQVLRHPLLGRLGFVLAQLNLTPDQRGQIKGFLETAQGKAKAIRQNTSLTPVQKRAEMQPVVKELRESIMSILTPEQKARVRMLSAMGPGPRVILTRVRAALVRLNLSPAQKQQIKGIFEDAMAKAKVVRESNLTPAQKQPQIQAIEKAARESIVAVLTPEQKAKLRKLLANGV